MRLVVVLLVALAACYSPRVPATCVVTCNADTECPSGLTCNGTVCTDGDPCGDPPGDAPIDELSPTAVCVGTPTAPLGQVCLDPPPALMTINSGRVIDTDDDPGCQHTYNGVTVCVIPVETINVGASITASGGLPLVLWSSASMTISGVVDVGSNTLAGRKGAGANPSTCASGLPLDGELDTTSSVGSGGAGGSFTNDAITVGGAAGGDAATTGAGGKPTPTQSPLAFHGGCAGGEGGDPSGSGSTSPGNGGGAVYIVAKQGITVTANMGRISAGGGGGGGGGASSAGGHGGGSGGWIVLDATDGSITDTSALIGAFGGGGGGGANSTTNGFNGLSAFGGSVGDSLNTSGCTNAGGGTGRPGQSTTGNGCGAGGGGGSNGLIQRFSI
jgi:hypothetical protein